MANLHCFPSDTLRFVCLSDTHNDDPSDYVPVGDVLLHAGDMTDYGTIEELRRAYDWISKLPHKVKVLLAGNHDLGLDSNHRTFSEEAVNLLTSEKARQAGIIYLDRETKTVAHYKSSGSNTETESQMLPLRIYGNAMTPVFLPSDYAFTYKPAPSPSSKEAWQTAPASFDSGSLSDWVPIHVTHGAPLHHLDKIPIAGLKGCPVQLSMVERTRPALSVFGHFHISNGWELTDWNAPEGSQPAVSSEKDTDNPGSIRCHAGGEGKGEVQIDVEERIGPGRPSPVLDLTGERMRVEPGKSSLLINAAWMTHDKRETPLRNAPYVVVMRLPGSQNKSGRL